MKIDSKFTEGSLVKWAPGTPENFYFLYTPGPMTVLSARWSDGEPSEYSMQFGGIRFDPGWIVTVEYDADSTSYYDPPLSSIFGKDRLVHDFHEKWLSPA